MLPGKPPLGLRPVPGSQGRVHILKRLLSRFFHRKTKPPKNRHFLQGQENTVYSDIVVNRQIIAQKGSGQDFPRPFKTNQQAFCLEGPFCNAPWTRSFTSAFRAEVEIMFERYGFGSVNVSVQALPSLSPVARRPSVAGRQHRVERAENRGLLKRHRHWSRKRRQAVDLPAGEKS